MKIVINSSPLIALFCIDQLVLIKELFEEIIIPQAVYDETVIDGNDEKLDKTIKQITNFKILKVSYSQPLEFIIDVLDRGEAEVIALAKELNINTVLLGQSRSFLLDFVFIRFCFFYIFTFFLTFRMVLSFGMVGRNKFHHFKGL